MFKCKDYPRSNERLELFAVIKNCLRMYSFNASLNFDRQDNLKRLEELTTVQEKVNHLSGVNRILPRAAVAKTNLFSTDKDSYSEGARGDGLMEEERGEDITGKGLHRCARKINLAANPVTDPDLVTRLEAALRWEENDGVLTWTDQVEGGAEHVDYPPAVQQVGEQALSPDHQGSEGNNASVEQGAPVGSSSSTTHGIKGGDSVCGDALGCESDVLDTRHKVEGANLSTISAENKLNSRSTHTHLCHIESQPVLPGSAEKHIAGLVRRKHSSRQVGSLTNLQDAEGPSGVHHRQPKATDDSGEERDTRSQGSEPATSARPSVGGNRSREHVPGCGGWDKE